MDSRVDLLYRKKHFDASVSGPSQSSASSGTTAAKAARPASQSIGDLIAGFAGLSIVPALPEVDKTPSPPCPISSLPEEMLVHIFRDVALLDVADFNRLSRVCKRFAYLVATEERIWRRVCEGQEFGFGGMHYTFQREISWGPLPMNEPLDEGSAMFLDEKDLADRDRREKLLTTKTLFSQVYGSSWRQMFRSRPRIRFNGCYISTVNYIRTGVANANHITWNSPVHIVTYYRYLRFYRDGTVISLLTTSEPADVVHYLSKDLLEMHRDGGASHLPSVVMSAALKGRWRLSSAEDNPQAPLEDIEGDLYIETEGVTPKYTWRMELSLRSAGKGARNNKLGWRGFYSYNKLTDDWGEFMLKNYKPFFFSRVKSYGFGESALADGWK
jgi:F-box protein 9